MTDVYQVNVHYAPKQRTTYGAPFLGCGGKDYDTEIFDSLPMAQARVTALTGAGIKAILAKSRK